MVKVITLPEKLIRERELVLIPRVEYEKLLNISEEQAELNKGIARSLKELKRRKVAGPFSNAKDLMKSLVA